MKKLLCTLPFLAFSNIAYADDIFKPTPFIGVSIGEGSTKVQISRKRVDTIGLDAYGAQAGVKWKYARASVNYDYLPNKLSNGQLISANIAAQYQIGKFTPFAGIGAGYSYNRKQGRTPVYVATAGVEYAIDDKWSVEARYRFIHPVQHSAKPTHVFGVGVTFRF